MRETCYHHGHKVSARRPSNCERDHAGGSDAVQEDPAAVTGITQEGQRLGRRPSNPGRDNAWGSDAVQEGPATLEGLSKEGQTLCKKTHRLWKG